MHRLIHHNAQLINELHDRLHDEFRKQPHGLAHKRACEEFNAKYDFLAFPGGYESGISKIEEGDPTAIEAALSFLEVRPYFFRSQYMRTKILRLLRHAPMTENQKARLLTIRQKKAERAGAANPHACGTFGTSAAEQPLVPKAGGDT